MRTIIFIQILLATIFSLGACGNGEDTPSPTAPTTDETNQSGDKTDKNNSSISGPYLIVYFSRTGNARSIATEIQKQIGGDLVEIKTNNTYPSDYNQMLTVGQQEINAIDNNGTYPGIQTSVASFEKYNAIFICTPLWWSRMSTPMQSFLHNNSSKMSKKKLLIAVTSASSGISTVIADAKRICPQSVFNENSLWVKSSEISNESSMIKTWLSTIKASSSK